MVFHRNDVGKAKIAWEHRLGPDMLRAGQPVGEAEDILFRGIVPLVDPVAIISRREVHMKVNEFGGGVVGK